MKAARLGFLVVLATAGLCWWHWTSNIAVPRGIAAIVYVPEDHSTCTVVPGGSTTGLHVSCQAVADYLGNTLKLTPGAGVVIKAHGELSHALSDQLVAAGFLLVPDMGAGITAETPRGDR